MPSGRCRPWVFRGGNCASPHQTAALEFLPRLTPAAEFAGAVNCIYREGETLVGENTEGKGFLEALRRRLDPAGKRIVLLGTGHTARAIAIELAPTRPAEIALVTQDEESGRLLIEALVNKFQVQASLLAFQDGTYVAGGRFNTGGRRPVQSNRSQHRGPAGP